jgi:hypothetical protein
VPDEALQFVKRADADTEPQGDKWWYRITCNLLRRIFQNAHYQIEAGLRQGVDAREFTATYAKAVADLDAVIAAVARIETKHRAGELGDFAGLEGDVRSLRDFLAKALSVARTPPREPDWQKVEEASTAYHHGETKSFQRLTKRA